MFFAETDSGISLPSLVSSLGSASAAVIVVGYFLAHLKAETTKHADLYRALQESFQEALEKVTDRHSETVRGVEERFQRVVDQQSNFITTVALAIKDIEATMRLKTATLARLERTVNTLHGYLEKNGGGSHAPYVSVPSGGTPDPD